MIQSNIHKGAQRKRMSDPSAKRRHHISQGDRVILEGEMCEGLYNLKEENSVRGEVSGISLGSSSLRGASRKTATGREAGQSVTGRRKSAFGKARDGPSHGGEQPKAQGEGARV